MLRFPHGRVIKPWEGARLLEYCRNRPVYETPSGRKKLQIGGPRRRGPHCSEKSSRKEFLQASDNRRLIGTVAFQAASDLAKKVSGFL